jgi:DnaJ-class molecular chaperone
MDVIIIQHISSGKTLIQCNRCEGSGENNYERMCHICEGKGSLVIEHEAPLIMCGRCKGTGENNYERFCSVCKGAGIVPSYGSWKHIL